MIETVAIAERFLWETLRADPTLAAAAPGGIWADVAPEGTPGPWVVFQEQTSVDVIGVGSARLMVDALYLVRAIGQTATFADLRPAADRVDTLLHRASGTTENGDVWHVTREAPFRMTDLDGGLHYRHLGGLFRLWIQAP